MGSFHTTVISIQPKKSKNEETIVFNCKAQKTATSTGRNSGNFSTLMASCYKTKTLVYLELVADILEMNDSTLKLLIVEHFRVLYGFYD